MYAIYESEMETLSVLDFVSTTAFTVSGACASFSIGLWTQGHLSAVTDPSGLAIMAIGIPSGFAFAVISAAVGSVLWLKRGGALRKIKSESRALTSDMLMEIGDSRRSAGQ